MPSDAKGRAITFVLGVAATLLVVWLSGPRNYADCMYRMAERGTELRLAGYACGQKFPQRQP